MRLGDYYYLGMGTPKNLKKALEMYEAGVVFAKELGGLDGIAESGLKKTLARIEEIKNSHLCLRSRVVTHGPA